MLFFALNFTRFLNTLFSSACQTAQYTNGGAAVSIDDTFYNMQYYPQHNSRLNHASKIQRQRSLNMEYPDEVDYQGQYDHHIQPDAFMYPNNEMTVNVFLNPFC